MSAELIKVMEKRGHSDIIEQILSSLKRFGLTADFEAIYTIVQALANPMVEIKKADL